jgi:hypothetical protein
MNHFATIASAREYVEKLNGTITDTLADIEQQIQSSDQRKKRTHGLMVVRYKLQQAHRTLDRGHAILRDLERLEKVLDCPTVDADAK